MNKKLAQQIIEHVENARAFDRKRQPTLRVDSSRSSSRIECLMCGVGIRKETTPINGMHPNCHKINEDPSLILKMALNTHAARAIADRLYIQIKRNDADIKREDAEKRAHAELLARFEAQEIALESSENAAS